jgi:hypothetical protein
LELILINLERLREKEIIPFDCDRAQHREEAFIKPPRKCLQAKETLNIYSYL